MATKPFEASVLSELDRLTVLIRSRVSVDGLVSELEDALNKTWTHESTAAIAEAITDLKTIDGPITQAEIDHIKNRLAQRLGRSYAEILSGDVRRIQEAVYLQGAQSPMDDNETVVASFVWTLDDRRSLDVLQRNTQFWVGDHYNEHVAGSIENILREYFGRYREGGLDRKLVAEMLEEAFRSVLNKSKAYWNLLADHTCHKIRSIGRVAGYEQAGIEYVRVQAILDSKTSAICRQMHGRIISVKQLRGQTNRYLKACETQDREAIKASWPWFNQKKVSDFSGKNTDQMVRSGAVAPPYHARCRTDTVAWFEGDEGSLECGNLMSARRRRVVNSYTPMEHKAFVDDVRNNADNLLWDKQDFRGDVLKWFVIKHGRNEFNVNHRDEYINLSRNIIKDTTDIYVVEYKGEVQYFFGSRAHRGYTVVDRNSEIRGCYGHKKPGGYDKWLNGRPKKREARLLF